MLSFIIKILILAAAVLVCLGVYYTIKSQSGDYQKQFLAGTAPTDLPDGFYKGSADFPTYSWQGKSFNPAALTGRNVLGVGSSAVEKYPFTLGKHEGLRDTKLEVVTLDYHRPENPFWLKPVLDEMVLVAPGEYLGKIHYRLIPYFPFTIGYFKMSK